MTTENNTETARPPGPSTPGNYLATSGDSCWPLTIESVASLGPLREALRAELASLGADQREALQLRVVSELPYAVVAQRLGVSEAVVRARVSRGLRALARALDPVLMEGGGAQ